ncbi:transposase family protein [Saccharothrix sp. BKS2]|uniref:transposase family protein n=1 Tax=Saccharothrix sp. BKS2 TaxID=3064400 RepID=UPI0039EBC34A
MVCPKTRADKEAFLAAARRLLTRPDADNRTYNALLRGLRCLGERGFALLTGCWRALRHFTTSPRKIDDIVKAALVLTHFEHGRLT